VKVHKSIFVSRGLIFLLFGIVSKAIPFFVFPVIANSYSVTDLGLIDLFLSLIVLVSTLALVGLDSSVIRYLDSSEIGAPSIRLISNIVTSLLVTSFVLCVLLIQLKSYFKPEIGILGDVAGGYVFAVIIGMAWSAIADVVLRCQENLGKYIIFTISSNAIIYVPILLLIDMAQLSPVRYIVVYSAAMLCSGLIGLAMINKYLNFKELRFSQVKVLQYGWPLMLVSVLSLTQPLLEKLLIKGLIDDVMLGLYAVALKLLMLVQLPITLFSNALIIEIIKLSKAEDSYPKTISLINFFALVSGLICSLFILSVDTIIGEIYDKRFMKAGDVASLLALGTFIYSVGGILSSGLILAERTRYKLVSGCLAVSISLLFSYIFISSLGILAIPLGLVVSKSFAVIFELSVSQKIYGFLESFWRDVSLYLVIIFIIVFLYVFFRL
jgi:O-antigen/teichoic acid export membrane protein